MKMTYGSRVWVIGWESAGPLPEGFNEVALLLSASLDVMSVKLVVQAMWNATSLNYEEQLGAASGKPVYEAQVETLVDGSLSITCGHNPFLTARIVSGVDVSRDPDGRQRVVIHSPD